MDNVETPTGGEELDLFPVPGSSTEFGQRGSVRSTGSRQLIVGGPSHAGSRDFVGASQSTGGVGSIGLESIADDSVSSTPLSPVTERHGSMTGPGRMSQGP